MIENLYERDSETLEFKELEGFYALKKRQAIYLAVFCWLFVILNFMIFCYSLNILHENVHLKAASKEINEAYMNEKIDFTNYKESQLNEYEDHKLIKK
tara:strand:- start:63 stop:356 length:294 start_codon:yes stop_codon:yes gene_type:complete